jgi:DNA-binding MarR family transcriptional regulator
MIVNGQASQYDAVVTTEPARETWAAVARIFFSDEMHDRFHDAAQAAGLPHPGALKCLLGLELGTPQSMRALADDMRCDASYITGLVDVLEKAGFVERRTATGDRRVKLVHLTRSGQKAKERADHVLTTPPKALDRLTDTEHRSLAKLLAKLADG